MSKKREAIFFAVLITLCVLLFAVKLTGGVFHAVFGVMLVILSVSHTCMHFVKLRYSEKRVRITNEVQFAALAVMFFTGMLMHPLDGILLIKIVHKLSAVVFVLAMLNHAAQHKAIRREREKQTEKKREMEEVGDVS